ncbi:MAG: epoxyqueuosine reductase [Elusimicrobia bacterium]|nr:epoxyqueuosine reductase [Elusimicrobiota bacterium]
MGQEKEHYHKLKEFATGLGFRLFGAADIRRLKEEFIFPPEVTNDLNYGIALGFPLQGQILEEIGEHPTLLYFNHYRQVNNFLDQSALKLAAFIQEQGYKSMPIPASQIVDWQNQKGHLSHKKIAAAAGLGWLGRNNLLVTPHYGAQVRLVTILTDSPLAVDKPLAVDCGTCQACIATCPAKAINKLQQDFDQQACFAQLKEFQRKKYVPQYICGICVKACQEKSR